MVGFLVINLFAVDKSGRREVQYKSFRSEEHRRKPKNSEDNWAMKAGSMKLPDKNWHG